MVTATQAVAVAVAVLALVVLGVAVPFLVGLVRDSVRRRDQRTEPPEDGPDVANLDPNHPATIDDGTGRVTCPHCGESNDPSFTFCRYCAGEL